MRRSTVEMPFFDTEKFDSFVESILRGCSSIGSCYTYIAEATDDKDSVFKIGMSKNPVKREKYIQGYRGFNYKMMYVLRGNIEYDLLHALYYSGATEPHRHHSGGKRSEAVRISKTDMQHVIEKLCFMPITEFAYGTT